MTEELEKPVYHILLVDDEANILKSVRRLLMQEEDYEISVATSGLQGLGILEGNEAAVVVSDQRMPEMEGVEFLEKVKKKWPDTVRILLTGYADIEASIGAINRGSIFRYLTKPWDEEQLLRTIKDATAQYFLVTENKRLNKLVAKQNVELQQWNTRLKQRVMAQTANISKKNDELFEANQDITRTLDETIQAFSALSELQDPRSQDHADRVSAIAEAMAVDLELSEDMRKSIRIAALLHDIGKIGTSVDIMKTPYNYMTPEEQQEYERHPIRGQAAIDRVEDLRSAGLLIRHHHEHYDGTGFPDRLEGEDIPLGSRILRMADAFQRYLPERMEESSIELALVKMRENLGSMFDSSLYSAVETAVVEVYQTEVEETEMVKLEVGVRELRVGMRLEQDVISGSGLLLLKRGTSLVEEGISAIQRHYEIDPFEGKIQVLVQK